MTVTLTSSSSTPTAADLVGALQDVLAGEHAAVYGYGVVGGQLAAGGAPAADVEMARSGLDAHTTRRDRLVALIRAAGGAAAPGATGYTLPFPVTTPAAARRLAATVESRCAGGYAQLVVAVGLPHARREPASWLRDAAVRQGLWLHGAPALPGLTAPSGSQSSPTP